MLEKLKNRLFFLFLFLLPWQTVWILQENFLNGWKWQYGTFVLYGSELLLWLVFILQLVVWIRERRFKILDLRFQITEKSLFIYAVWGLVLWSGLSILWSGDKMLAFYAWGRLLEGLAVMFLILNLKINWQKIAWPVVLAGVVQGVLAIYQFLNQAIFANKFLGLAEHLPKTLGTLVVETAHGRWLRAYGAFNHPNILAGFLVICFFLALRLYVSYQPSWFKVGATLSLLVITAGLFFTFSRSAWLGLIIAYSLWFIVYNLKSKEQWRLSAYLLILFLVLFMVYYPLVLSRFNGHQKVESFSQTERSNYLNDAGRMIKSNWLFGTGIGNYTSYLYKLNPKLNGWDYQPVHNIYLLVLAELGVVGFILYLLILKKTAGHHLILALLLIGLFDHYFWTSYVAIVMFWLAIGIIMKKT